MRFTRGDQVICINSAPNTLGRSTGLLVDCEYTVTDTGIIAPENDATGGGEWVRLAELPPPHPDIGWAAERFRRAVNLSTILRVLETANG